MVDQTTNGVIKLVVAIESLAVGAVDIDRVAATAFEDPLLLLLLLQLLLMKIVMVGGRLGGHVDPHFLLILSLQVGVVSSGDGMGDVCDGPSTARRGHAVPVIVASHTISASVRRALGAEQLACPALDFGYLPPDVDATGVVLKA